MPESALWVVPILLWAWAISHRCDQLLHRVRRLESRPSPSDGGHLIDQFSEELGATVRDCLNCGVLVPGGPSRCTACARLVEPDRPADAPGARHDTGNQKHVNEV